MFLEQRDNVIKEFKKFGKDKEIQDKLKRIKMRIIFGGNFSIKWFLPFSEGGKRYLYYYLRHKKVELYLKQKELNGNDNSNNNDIREKEV
jgi:hypothetical protein